MGEERSAGRAGDADDVVRLRSAKRGGRNGGVWGSGAEDEEEEEQEELPGGGVVVALHLLEGFEGVVTPRRWRGVRGCGGQYGQQRRRRKK